MKENQGKGFKLERRQFIQSVVGTGLLAGMSLSVPNLVEASDSNNEEKYAMLVDKHQCVGCNACTRVCNDAYDLSYELYRTRIHRFDENSDEYFKKNACLHCNDASCKMACPTGAIYKDGFGLTQIDNSICVNCGYCIANCPFDAIQYDRTRGVNEKCTLCAPLINAGSTPLCYQECPVDAIHFGKKEDMLELGTQKVEELKDQGYDNASLYGDTELGGLSVLGVLAYEPEKYEYPKNPEIPLSLRAWNSIPFAPAFVVIGGAAMVFNFLHTKKTNDEFKKSEEDEE